MIRTSRTSRHFLSSIAIAVFAVATSVQGAILTLDGVVRVSVNDNIPVDLTAQGSLDWAYWAPTGSNLTPLVAPTNEKDGGNAIGSLDIIGGTHLRGSGTSSTPERYSFTDGTSPESGMSLSLAGLIFNQDLGNSANGKGLKLSIAGDPAEERIVTLYLGGFGATSNLKLTLNGVAQPITDSQVFDIPTPKQMDVYTLRFQPDSSDDLLLVEYTASAITNTSGHVGLQAVTVSVVPEPSAATLLFLGGLAFCRRRRR